MMIIAVTSCSSDEDLGIDSSNQTSNIANVDDMAGHLLPEQMENTPTTMAEPK